MRFRPSLALAAMIASTACANLPPQIAFHLDTFAPARSPLPNLADVLTIVSRDLCSATAAETGADADSACTHQQPRASMFYNYARDSVLVSTLLANPLTKSTLFVPTNSAILSLARRPHQPSASAQSMANRGDYVAREAEDASTAHLENWVQLHTVPRAIELASDEQLETLLKGRSVRVIMQRGPREGEVMGRAHSAGVVEDGENRIEILQVVEVRSPLSSLPSASIFGLN